MVGVELLILCVDWRVEEHEVAYCCDQNEMMCEIISHCVTPPVYNDDDV